MTYEVNNRLATVIEMPVWAHHRFEIIRMRAGKKQVSAWANDEERADAIAREWAA